MEFIGSHDAGNIVSAGLFIILGHTQPELGNGQEHLQPVVLHEDHVLGVVVVVPNVVRHSQRDMALTAGIVRIPLVGNWVQVHELRLFIAVHCRLPREHGPFMALAGRVLAGRRQTPVAVFQQTLSQVRIMLGIKRNIE